MTLFHSLEHVLINGIQFFFLFRFSYILSQEKQKMVLSVQRRWEIVFLHKHPLGPKMSTYAIAKYIGCDLKTVENWLKRYEETNDVQEKEGRGRKRKFSEILDKKLIRAIEKEPTTSSRCLSARLKAKGVSISPSTIQKRLRESGVTYRNPIPKPLLTERHRLQRLQWARKYKNQDCSKVIFTDESSFSLFSSLKKLWIKIGSRIFVPKVKHSPKIHVWACFSWNGLGKIFLFKKNLNAIRLCKIYASALLPSARKWFGDSNDHWVLQEDNDPKHQSKFANEWRAKKKITRLPWPARSPDLNPVENIWAILKSNVRYHQPKNLKELASAIRKEWKNLSIEYAQNLVASVQRRIKDVLEKNGDHILY